MAYAENTTVPIEKSIAEIVALVKKAGAERVAQYEEPDRFTVQFELGERTIRFRVRLLTYDDVPRVLNGRPRSEEQIVAKRDALRRQRARALLLVVKAKLESVESQVETFEEAFLANLVMSDGATLYERVAEPIALEYRSGAVRPMLLGGPG